MEIFFKTEGQVGVAKNFVLVLFYVYLSLYNKVYVSPKIIKIASQNFQKIFATICKYVIANISQNIVVHVLRR